MNRRRAAVPLAAMLTMLIFLVPVAGKPAHAGHPDSRQSVAAGGCRLSGGIAEFPLPTSGTQPQSIVSRPDGRLWFTESAVNAIGYVRSFSGTHPSITEFSAPPIAGAFIDAPSALASGPGGSVWFTDPFAGAIRRLSAQGQFTTFPISSAGGIPGGIVEGPDNNLWFADFSGDAIGRLTPSGQFTEFPTPTAGSEPFSIARGPDNGLWFTETKAGKIGHISMDGRIREFRLPANLESPVSITAGPDNDL